MTSAVAADGAAAPRDAPAAIPAFRVERATRESRIGALAGLVALAVLVAAPFLFRSSVLRTLVDFFALLALAQFWNVLAGYAGLVSVGQQAFVGVGAYSLVVFGDKLGLNPFLVVPLAGLVAAALALPVAALVFRLRGGYFAIGTWVVAEVFLLLTVNVSQLGSGTGQTLTSVAGVARQTREYATYWIALGVAVFSILSAYALVRSHLGLALQSVRDDEAGAGSLGVDVTRPKLLAWVYAAFGGGVTGAVLHLNLLRVSPFDAYSVEWTAFVLFIVVIGGVGTLPGPILGAVLFVVLRETLADYGSWYLILLGAVAVATVVVAPRGIWGTLMRRRAISLFPTQRRLHLEAAPSAGLPAPAFGRRRRGDAARPGGAA